MTASGDTRGHHLNPLRAWLMTETPRSATQARIGRFYRTWLRFRRSFISMIGLIIVIMLFMTAVLVPWLAPASPVETILDRRLLPPSKDFWFGTDELGRDIYTRVIHGSRITLYVVVVVGAIVVPIGILFGIVAGYFGGWLDQVLMRITDICMAFPRLVLALAFVVAIGPGIKNAVLAISFTTWPPFARIVRAETLTVRNSDYILAARQQGASAVRILLNHILPMCISSVIIRLTLDMARIILVAAGLGFLGMGAQPPAPEWGSMVSTGREFLFDFWWIATIPGIAILVVSLGFNLLGDGLRDVLDPKYGS